MNQMEKTIFFDMDGTIADLYGVAGWLEYLERESCYPYAYAKPLLHLASLARKLNALQKQGYRLGIISWTSKSGSKEYNAMVSIVKQAWLNTHLPSVQWDEVHIVPYGTPKQMFCRTPADILFDDEKKNRDNWTGIPYDVQNIMEILRAI
jgi:histidinol phosphatase-like enzyme